MADPDKPVSGEKIVDMARAFIEEGGTIGMVRGFSDTDLEEFYSAAYALYDHGKYEKAQTLFRFLCLHDHLRKRNWMGFGATCQVQQKFNDAVTAYSVAVMLDHRDPWPHLHAGECYMSVRNWGDARNALRAALGFAGNKTKYSRLKKRAKNLLRKTGQNSSPARP